MKGDGRERARERKRESANGRSREALGSRFIPSQSAGQEGWQAVATLNSINIQRARPRLSGKERIPRSQFRSIFCVLKWERGRAG